MPTSNKQTTFIILLTAFLAGGAVMALEISASRLLAPYFGASMLIWTNIIGVVLSALSLGYWLGGKWADRNASLHSVSGLLAIAGLWALLMPWIVKAFTPFISHNFSDLNFSILIPVFVISCITFALPVGVLGAVNPILVKKMADINTHIGKSAGGVGAWSTLGSILGTFLAGLVLVPLIGTRNTILGIAWLLLALSFCLFVSKKKSLSVLLIGLMLSSPFALNLPVRQTEGLLYEGETPYHFVQVTKNNEGTRSMVFNAGLGVQSLYSPTGEHLKYGYYELFGKLPSLFFQDKTLSQRNSDQPLQVLMLGLAGGGVLHTMHKEFGNQVNLETVEIDGKVVELAEKYFDIKKLPVKVTVEDARIFLTNTQKKYDLIIVDAYQNELLLPWQLTTVEFWQLLKNALNPNGLVTANFLTGPPITPLLSALLNTTTKEFPNVWYGSTGFANQMILASQRDFDLNNNTNPDFPLFTRASFNAQNMVLTDDHAPIEYLAFASFMSFAK